MQNGIVNQLSETKRLIKWIGENPTSWEAICGRDYNGASYWDQIEVIKDLQQNEFYDQILNLVFNPHNGIQHIAQNAIIDEIIETWDKEQWNDLVSKIIQGLNIAHQELKRQRAESATNGTLR